MVNSNIQIIKLLITLYVFNRQKHNYLFKVWRKDI